MKIKKGFVVRKVGNEHVVVPVGELSKTFHGMINLNETGAFLWNFFTRGCGKICRGFNAKRVCRIIWTRIKSKKLRTFY